MSARCTVFVLLCACSRVYAEPAASVELELPSCLDASWREQLVNSARLELREDGATLVTHRGNDRSGTRIAIDLACGDNPSDARISLARPEQTTAPARAIQLSDIPRHLRARTLALAIAELWRSSHAQASTASTSALKNATATTAPAAHAASIVTGERNPVSSPLAAAASSDRHTAAPPAITDTRNHGPTPDNSSPATEAPPLAADTRTDRQAAGATPPTAAAPVAADALALQSAPAESPPRAAASAGPGEEATTFDERALPVPGASQRATQPAATGAERGRKRAAPAQRPVAANAGVELSAGHATPQLAAAADAKPQQPIDAAEPTETSAIPSQRDAPTLSIAPALRLYFAARDALPGAQAAFSWKGWRIGAEGYYSSHADTLGSARFGLVQGFLSWELAHVELGAYGLALGPRAAIGGILATANAQVPAAYSSSATLIAWDASGEAAFWRTLSNHWRLAVRLQLGYAQGTILASDVGELARLHGLFATAGLALELHLTDS